MSHRGPSEPILTQGAAEVAQPAVPVQTAAPTSRPPGPAPNLTLAVSRAEPLILLGLLPFLWFPRPESAFVLFLMPAFWILRRVARGRLSVRTPYDIGFAALLTVLPLALLPLVQWPLALPKVLLLLAGVAIVYAIANSLETTSHVLAATYATIALLGGAISVAGLVGAEWPTATKLLPLEAIWAPLPRLVTGVVHGTQRGGINPNEIGGALALLAPLGVASCLGRWSARERTRNRAPLALLVASVGLMAFVLLLTQSRSAYFGAGVGLLTVLAWSAARGRGRIGVTARAAVATTAVAAAAAAWALLASWSTSGDGELGSLQSRVELWHRGWMMLQGFPVTGIGMGQFSAVLHALYPPLLTAPNEFVPHAHNFALQLALDLGLPGAFAFGLVLLGFGRAVLTAYRASADPQVRTAAVGLGAGMIAYLTYGLTDAIVLGARGGLGLWIVLGLAAALARSAIRQDRQPSDVVD